MQTLPEFFSQKYSPNTDQARALESLHDFLHSDRRCFLLKVYAGTGKIFLTKGLTQYIQHMGLSPVLLAPTWRVARILSEKTGLHASTIHKGIYNLAKLDKIEINKNDKVSYKFCYEDRPSNQISGGCISSMKRP